MQLRKLGSSSAFAQREREEGETGRDRGGERERGKRGRERGGEVSFTFLVRRHSSFKLAFSSFLGGDQEPLGETSATTYIILTCEGGFLVYDFRAEKLFKG